LQCDLESSQTSELQMSQRVEELESTVRRLQAECSSHSFVARDSCADATDSDAVRDLTAENVSALARLVSCFKLGSYGH